MLFLYSIRLRFLALVIKASRISFSCDVLRVVYEKFNYSNLVFIIG